MSVRHKRKDLIRVVRSVLIAVCAVAVLSLCLNVDNEKQKEAEYGEDVANNTEHVEEQEMVSEEAEGLNTVIEEKPQDVLVEEKKEASYEQWLAGGMVVAISMEFPEFELMDIYLAGETDVSNKDDSEGVYVIFNTEGERLMAHSKSIAEERDVQGATDLYTEYLGFATFDLVEANVEKLQGYKRIELDELQELISQSLLVSIYQH